MRKMVLDMQSGIHAHNMERMLMQKLEDYQVVVSESPDSTAEWCKVHKPKREGLIDAFLFGSVSENYFASVVDSM